jgi:ribosomal protein S12 methylthiotransferase accessory factor YcaO
MIMQIEVKEPGTGALLRLDAKTENYKGLHGMRIRYPNGASFFIVAKSGAWRSADDHHVAPGFLANIGLALEGRKLSEQIVDHEYHS